MDRSLYSVNVDQEYKEYIDDISKALVTIATIQFLFWLNVKAEVNFLKNFNLVSIYFIMGITVYHLIFKRIITFS